MTHYVTEILFADDMAMLALSNDDLQAMVTILDTVSLAFGQEISVPKSEVVVVVKQDAPKPDVAYVPRASIHLMRYSAKEVEGETVMGYYRVLLAESYCFKYLGSRTNARGSMEDEVEARERAMCMAWSSLKERVFVKYALPLTTRFAVYTAMVLSAGMYASSVAHHTKAEVGRLEARHFGFVRQMVRGAAYTASREEVIVRAAKEGVCVIPMELLMQQAQLRFAAHIERHSYVGDVEPYLPRVVSHSVIAIPGQEPWLTRNGTIRKSVTHPTGFRKSLAKAYSDFGGKAHGPFDTMALDKSWWKDFVNIQGLRRAMKVWLAKRFAKRTARRIAALVEARPILEALNEATGEGWEPQVMKRACSSLGCGSSEATDAVLCWTCHKAFCWACMTDSCRGHACAALRHRRAAEEVASAITMVVEEAPSRRRLGRAKRRAERGAVGAERRRQEEAVALKGRREKAAKAEAAKLAAEATAKAERKAIALVAKDAEAVSLVARGRAHLVGDFDDRVVGRYGYVPAPKKSWRTAKKGRYCQTWSEEGKVHRLWWFIPGEDEIVEDPFVAPPTPLRSSATGEERTAALGVTPSPVQAQQALQTPDPDVLEVLVPATSVLCQRDHERSEGRGLEPGMRLDAEELGEKDDSDAESGQDDSDEGRSSSDNGGVRGSDADTAGAISDESASDVDGGQVTRGSQAQPGDYVGAGVMLIDYTVVEVLAVWEPSLARKLRRKQLDSMCVKRQEEARVKGVAAVGTSADCPAIKLGGWRMEGDPRVRKRRIELVNGGEQEPEVQEGDAGEAKKARNPLTNRQRGKKRYQAEGARRKAQRRGLPESGYTADSERG